jgi:hypothetical protein
LKHRDPFDAATVASVRFGKRMERAALRDRGKRIDTGYTTAFRAMSSR